MDEEEHDASSMLIHMAVEAWDVHNIFMPFNLWIMLTDGTSGLENLHMIERETERERELEYTITNLVALCSCKKSWFFCF